MSAQLAVVPGLGEHVLAHLDGQLESSRRLLDAVLRQGHAIRSRDVQQVVARLSDIQAEMGRRGALESARTTILAHAGAALGLPPHGVTIDALATLLSPAHAGAARERSAELRGLLAEIAREHGINRALMRQELAFLSHLTRLVGGEPEPAYRPGAAAPGAARGSAASAYRVLDLQA